MRAFILLFLGSVAACAGETAPDTSSKTSTGQQAEPASSSADDAARQRATASRSSASDDEYGSGRPRPAAECWDYGAPAPGECNVGDTEFCSNASPAPGAPPIDPNAPVSCEHVCVNDNGKAVWKTADCSLFATEWHRDLPGCGCGDQHDSPYLPGGGFSSSTPLVLSFDDAPVTFNTTAGSAFDLVADGQCHGSDWPSAATPWLALDRDGNGSIDDGSELFGSAVRLADGTRAHNGFEALRELDANHDGVFDANDEAFARVVVWTDKNGDRTSTPNELTSLADADVRSISLADRMQKRCDARGNCEGERSLFTTTAGRRGTVVDVYLKTR